MKARFTPALFAHAEAVLGLLLRFDYPADAVVSRYFREHRELGHADRAFVAETVFAVLRRGRSLEARCAGKLSDRNRLLVALAVTRGWSQRELAPVLNSAPIEGALGVVSSRPDVPVAAMARRHGGATYVFAVGMRDAPTEATFTLAARPRVCGPRPPGRERAASGGRRASRAAGRSRTPGRAAASPAWR